MRQIPSTVLTTSLLAVTLGAGGHVLAHASEQSVADPSDNTAQRLIAEIVCESVAQQMAQAELPRQAGAFATITDHGATIKESPSLKETTTGKSEGALCVVHRTMSVSTEGLLEAVQYRVNGIRNEAMARSLLAMDTGREATRRWLASHSEGFFRGSESFTVTRTTYHFEGAEFGEPMEFEH